MHDLIRLEETADRAALMCSMIKSALECAAAQQHDPSSAQAWLTRALDLATKGQAEMIGVWNDASKERRAFEASCPENGAEEQPPVPATECSGAELESEWWLVTRYEDDSERRAA